MIMGLLVLVSLACEQSGQILSIEDATRAAEEASSRPRPISEGNIVTEGPQIGQDVNLIGSRIVVNLYNEPNGRISAGAGKGSTVTILDITDEEGELWFLIHSSGGDGWVREENIEAIASEESSEVVFEGPQPGDTVYIGGVGYLINLYSEPGGLIIAGQEKGTEIVILSVERYKDVLWYYVDAPTGEGWIPAENISTEAP